MMLKKILHIVAQLKAVVLSVQRTKMDAIVACVLFLYFCCCLFICNFEIKEIFSFNLSSRGFFIHPHAYAQEPHSQSRQSAQDHELGLTAVSVSSCRGEPGRKSYPCRSWVSTACHPAQQHLHLLDSRRRHRARAAVWTLALVVWKRGVGTGWLTTPPPPTPD